VIPEEGHSLHSVGVNQFNVQSTIAWYARYDQGPLVVTPLKSGTPALVSGYWKTPSQPHTLRFLEQGEIAPAVAGAQGNETWWELDHPSETR
jgi:hypothetical protein